MRRVLPLLCLLAAAGCGGDGGGATAPAPTETPAKAAGKVVHARMKNTEFVPRTITIHAGDRVVWRNADDVAHTVMKDSGTGAEFFSGQLESGKSFEQAFATPGKVSYVCTNHPTMVGTIVVK